MPHDLIGCQPELKKVAKVAEVSINAFHSDYLAAVQHYLEHGIQEGRLGYKEGGYHDQDGRRWTISNGHDLFVSASSRTGAAIDSVVWNNKEFINSADHGRELQMACNTDHFTECFNPTEAGGRDDWIETTTKTVINHVSAHGQVLHTTVHPAHWMRPGTRHRRDGCGNGSPALNTKETYEFPFNKTVTIGCAGSSNCIEFISKFTIGGHWPDGFTYIQMEAPTGYMTGEFTKAYNFNTGTHQVEDHHSNDQPVVMATADGKYAMGVYTPPGQNTDAPQYYGIFFFPEIKGFNMQTSKWNVVYRKRKPNNTMTYTYKTYICVGDLNVVKLCLTKVVHAHPHI
ncbi:hypothetical protein ACJMK2_016382 [Sinanodonta woodiana]|uniref:Uncharacterized protein n=1 Tax=Sinanodonta woodiana TaxID=1069815 RepID=A0ABD3UVI1_SINWO